MPISQREIPGKWERNGNLGGYLPVVPPGIPPICFSFFLARSSPGFSREIPLVLADFVFLFQYFPLGDRHQIQVVSRFSWKISKFFQSKLVSRFLPIGLQWPLSKFHVVSRFLPKKISENFTPNCLPVSPDRFTVTTFKNPCRFLVSPEKKNFPEKICVVSRFFPQKISKSPPNRLPISPGRYPLKSLSLSRFSQSYPHISTEDARVAQFRTQ